MEAVNRCPDAEQLSLHALGSLDSNELAAVERHLAVCPGCRRELEGLTDTLASLALRSPLQAPPEGLKSRVMASIDSMQQQPAPPMRLTRRWTTWGVAAVAAVLVLAFGLYSYSGDVSTYRAVQKAVADAKRQGARVVALEGTKEAPRAQAELYVVDMKGGARRVIVTAEGLTKPTDSQVYCLWLIQNGQRSVGGWITVDRRGRGGLMFDTNIPFDAVGVTLEPEPEYYEDDYGQMVPRGPKVLGTSQKI